MNTENGNAVGHADPAKQPFSGFIVVCRILVGGTFVLAATLKLIAPIENFEAAVRIFHMAPAWLEHPLALTLPWIELFAGAFCLLGLYTRLSAAIMAVMLAAFT